MNVPRLTVYYVQSEHIHSGGREHITLSGCLVCVVCCVCLVCHVSYVSCVCRVRCRGTDPNTLPSPFHTNCFILILKRSPRRPFSPPLPHPLFLPLERLTAQESGGYGGRGKYTVRVRVCCVRQSGVCVSIILPLFRMLSPSPSLILMMPVPLLLSY